MDIGAANWTEDDASNNQAAPDGAPEGMPPGGLNNTMRAMMGAIKRWWNQSVPHATAGTATAFTLSYTVAPGALVDGMTHVVMFHVASGPSPTLNVNSLGPKPFYAWNGTAWAQVTTAGLLQAGFIARVAYNQTEGSYRILRPMGTAADFNVGTGSNNVVQLDANGQMPQVPGIVQTGMRMGWTGDPAALPSGWALSRGLTIGDASSNATERANPDTLALFTLWYNTKSDAICPIKTAGGAATTRAAQGSAAAAFAAHCQLTMLNYQDRFVVGSGGSIAATPSTTGGASTVTLTTANLPPHHHGNAGATVTLGGSGGGSGLFGSPGNANTDDGPGTSAPVSILPPYIGEPQIVKL